MNSVPGTDATGLLRRAHGGDKLAADQLVDLVYDELREMAAAQLRQEPPGHTLQPTSLVHEAFIKLIDQERVEWQGRTHFLAVGAQAMRRILVDHARRKKRQKRGRGRKRTTFDELLTVSRYDPDDVVAVHEVLADLEALNSRQARIVEARFFASMTAAEVAEHLGISKSTVDREWRVARAWLRKQMSEDDQS
jgi:RNA polymerase sigma factor (TIGR02999 family)